MNFGENGHGATKPLLKLVTDILEIDWFLERRNSWSVLIQELQVAVHSDPVTASVARDTHQHF